MTLFRKQNSSARAAFCGFALLSFTGMLLPAAFAAAPAMPTATELAKRVDDHYNKLKSLKAGFAEQYDGLGTHRDESGTLLLRKPGKMRWDYLSVPGKVFLLDGKYAWFYTPGTSQVQRIPAQQLDDLRSPLRFLLGHTKIESELTKLAIAAHTGDSYTLAGVPKGLEKRVAKLSLTVTEAGVIEGIVIEELDGAITRFQFKNEEPNAAIPESTFHFAPPTGVPVIDAPPPV